MPILKENLDELQQTIQLMQSSNSDEYYDVSTRNKKYGRVDAMNGPALLEKYAPCHLVESMVIGNDASLTTGIYRLTHSVQTTSSMNEKLSALSSRLGMKSS